MAETVAAPLGSSGSVGVIIPPPEVKLVVDHTANFIRTKGAHYEQVLLANNRNSAKFAFLESGSPFHAYYRQRVEFGEAAPALQAREAVSAKLAAAADAGKPAAAPQKKTARIQTLTEKLVDYMRQAKIAPDTSGQQTIPQHEYYVRHPEAYPSLDLEVIQLTGGFRGHIQSCAAVITFHPLRSIGLFRFASMLFSSFFFPFYLFCRSRFAWLLGPLPRCQEHQ